MGTASPPGSRWLRDLCLLGRGQMPASQPPHRPHPPSTPHCLHPTATPPVHTPLPQPPSTPPQWNGHTKEVRGGSGVCGTCCEGWREEGQEKEGRE